MVLLLVAAIALLLVGRVAGARFYSLRAHSKVFLVVFLVAYLASGLTALDFQDVCAVLVPLSSFVTLSARRRLRRCEERPLQPFPFLASLAYRGPPAS